MYIFYTDSETLEEVHDLVQEGARHLQEVSHVMTDVPRAAHRLQSGLEDIRKDVRIGRQENKREQRLIRQGIQELKEQTRQNQSHLQRMHGGMAEFQDRSQQSHQDLASGQGELKEMIEQLLQLHLTGSIIQLTSVFMALFFEGFRNL